MELRPRLERIHETIQTIELASAQRMQDGSVLMRANRHGTAIYLFGYAAEMILKVAAFKIDGHRPDFRIGSALVPLRRQWAKRHMPNVPDEGFHSLVFWYQVVRRKRELNEKSVSRPIDRRAEKTVARLYQSWWTPMRYHPDQALPSEARRIYTDVQWLMDHRVELWR